MAMSATPYRVFVSHGSDDRWIAGQIARRLGELGAETFLDETNIPKGANFKQIIHKEIALSNEVVALFTPWSAKRSWVWIEMGAAWGQSKPVVAVFHGMELDDLDQNGQGKGMLEDINTLKLNEWGIHLTQVTPRCSMRRCGGLSARSDGVRGPLRDRGGLPRLSDAAALAGRLSLSGLWP